MFDIIHKLAEIKCCWQEGPASTIRKNIHLLNNCSFLMVLHTAAASARPITVRNLWRSCSSCPSQWEGDICEIGSIYIRYRRGTLSARVSLIDREAVSGVSIYEHDIGEVTGDRLGDCMTTAEMKVHLAGICVFEGPCIEDGWDR
jgi:hypothetical protein